MLEFVAPEIGGVNNGRRSFKAAAMSVGKRTLKKQLGSGCKQRKSFQQNLLNKPVAREGTFKKKQFSLIMSTYFWYQPFMAVSGNLRRKVRIVDDVLSSHEQEDYPTTPFDENCKMFEFETEYNYYVDLRQSFLALKLKNVKGPGYDT